jgi:2-polyprenyl-6-methoxyphenol hydroxylase-like FAD-dependent oxidoreductase
VAIAPQWDFLNLLAHTAAAYPTFHLLMQSQAIGLLRDDSGRVTGVRYRDAGGREQELHGDVVFGTDGRHSTIRPAAGLRTESFGAPFDVLWFRLPKSDAEKDELYFRVAPYRWVVGFDRRTYIQMAYIIRKGAHEQVQAEGIDRFRTHLAQVVPEVADRVGALRSFDDIKFLEVQVNRAPRWHQPGLLLIGDAAHAMSPIGGVGVNYAIQDAVAAANLLADHLLRAQRSGTPVPEEALHRVQRRRMLPTVVIQTLQRIMQARLIEPALRGHVSAVPRVARVLQRVGPLRRLFVRTLIVGVRPERIETPLVYPTPRAQPRRRAG